MQSVHAIKGSILASYSSFGRRLCGITEDGTKIIEEKHSSIGLQFSHFLSRFANRTRINCTISISPPFSECSRRAVVLLQLAQFYNFLPPFSDSGLAPSSRHCHIQVTPERHVRKHAVQLQVTR